MMVDRSSIEETERRIRPYVRHTPTLIDGAVALKLEFMQHAGSFKTRGAFANLLGQDVPSAGVVAASGGNHGAAVAYAARALGIAATIFVPSVSSPAKVERIRQYGARVVVGGAAYSEAFEASVGYQCQSGALAVHAFDAPQTVAGQGTVGLELEAAAPGLDTVLVAVGGGGLMAGITAWYDGRVRVVAVEPEGAPTLHDALAAGEPVDAPVGSIAVDSLAPRRVGRLPFDVATAHHVESVLVSDDDIRAAMDALWDRYRILAEPGGSAAFSALLAGRYRPAATERVGIIISGANRVLG